MRCLVDPELTRVETELFHHIYRRAAKALPQDGHLTPGAFFRAGPRSRLPGLKPGNIAGLNLEISGTDDGKDAFAQMLREFAKHADADLAILVFESWMIKPNEEEAQYMKERGEFLVPPSQHPQRIEIVLFSVDKPGGHNWSAWTEIQRNGNGVPSITAVPPALEYLQSQGRFANILDDTGVRPSLS